MHGSERTHTPNQNYLTYVYRVLHNLLASMNGHGMLQLRFEALARSTLGVVPGVLPEGQQLDVFED